MRIVCIDADALTYASSKETLKESINTLNDKIYNIFKMTEATHYIMVISKGPYFRHSIDPQYKSNRSASSLKWLKTLKAFLEEGWHAMSQKGLEADDICSIIMHSPEILNLFEVEIVLASTDKDLLKNIPGTHLDYRYVKAANDHIDKGTWITTSEEDAHLHKHIQYLQGGLSPLPL